MGLTPSSSTHDYDNRSRLTTGISGNLPSLLPDRLSQLGAA